MVWIQLRYTHCQGLGYDMCQIYYCEFLLVACLNIAYGLVYGLPHPNHNMHPIILPATK
jgi:hypothetical protein